MADRGSGLVAALIVVVVLTVGAMVFFFISMVQVDDMRQQLSATESLAEKLKLHREDLEKLSNTMRRQREDKEAEKGKAEGERAEVVGWLRGNIASSVEAQAKLDPASRRLLTAVSDRRAEFDSVENAMGESYTAYLSDKRTLREALRVANDRLMNTIRQYKEEEKLIDTEIGQIEAELKELRARLDLVQAQSMRRRTISDAGGRIIKVGAAGTNLAVLDLGTADRIRKGMRFTIWEAKRGFGTGWVEIPGKDFIKENILPGDWLVVGRGADERRYAIVSVGVSREAEERGIGLTRRAGNNTLKILGPGITRFFSVLGADWRIERATEQTLPAAEHGAIVKGMVEVVSVRAHSSDAVILPERTSNPVCPQCGWEAYDPKMKNCPYCSGGDTEDEVQSLEPPVETLLSKGEDIFVPIAEGDRLSNPLFTPNRPLVFVVGHTPVQYSRQMIMAVIKANNGRMVDPQVLLTRPGDDKDPTRAVDALPFEVNYLIPGIGPDAEDLTRRARILGIRIMREDEIFEFFGDL